MGLCQVDSRCLASGYMQEKEETWNYNLVCGHTCFMAFLTAPPSSALGEIWRDGFVNNFATTISRKAVFLLFGLGRGGYFLEGVWGSGIRIYLVIEFVFSEKC